MAFKKREKSPVLDSVRTRLAAMKQIDTAQAAVVNYGSDKEPCSSATIDAQCQKYEQDLAAYNGLLAQADDMVNNLNQQEADLSDAASRVLLGARAKFGRDSTEVEQLGGKRLSDRKKPAKKTAPVAK